MDESLQVIIVTAAAAVAFGALVRPYLKKPAEKSPASAAPCANCAASAGQPPPRQAARAHVPPPQTH
jgi:hypothetical protein